MAEIKVAIGVAVVEAAASAALKLGKEKLLKEVKHKVTNITIRKILIAMLTDENKSRLASLGQVDYAQAITNLTNANALLSYHSDSKSEEFEDKECKGEENAITIINTTIDVDKLDRKEVELLESAKIKESLVHYLVAAEQAAIRAYHCSKTFGIDFQFRCARLLVETSCLYAVLQDMPSSEIERRLNEYQVLIAEIMNGQYGNTILKKVVVWVGNKEELNNEIIKSQRRRREIDESRRAMCAMLNDVGNVRGYMLNTKIELAKIEICDIDKNIEKLKKKLTKLSNSFSMGTLIEGQTKMTVQVLESLKLMFPF